MMPHSFYAIHSDFTDPKEFQPLLEELPNDLFQLMSLVHNVLLHRSDGELFGYPVPETRFSEMNLRSARNILDHFFKMKNTGLNTNPNPANKVIGCCRDFALLLCAMLRQKNIPSRLRYGFTTFQMPGFHHDQVLLEYWHENCWRLVDARLNEACIKKHNLKIDFCLTNVPRDKFISAGTAWRLCRENKANPNKFGALFPKRMSGWWYIRNKIMQDLAGLNKIEVLLWDCWGWMLQEGDLFDDVEQIKILDEIANQSDEAQLIKIYSANRSLSFPRRRAYDRSC